MGPALVPKALAAVTLVALCCGVPDVARPVAAPPARAWALPASPAGAACTNATAYLTDDYGYVVGAADFTDLADPDHALAAPSSYRWFVNDRPTEAAGLPLLLQLPFDGDPTALDGTAPVRADGVAYAPGHWSQALALGDQGVLAYPRAGHLELAEGTIEMWVAMRDDGTAPAYTERNHVLFQYRSPGGDNVGIVQAGSSGILYAGGSVGGQWQSAYGSRGSTRDWRAGEWHHVVFSFSATENKMRFYLDGALVADTNEGRYVPPAADGATFTVGGDAGGHTAAYWLDSVSVWRHAEDARQIAAHAHGSRPPAANEVWLPTDQLQDGDRIAFEITPATDTASGAPCTSPPIYYPGIPITDVQPPSTLLPAGAISVTIDLGTSSAASCAYSVGQPLAYAAMMPFGSRPAAFTHRTQVTGLDPDPNTVNDVYVRCTPHQDYLLHLRYRALSEVDPSFPRTGNLWGYWGFVSQPLEHAARIDLWLGADYTAAQIRALRQLNPAIRVLTSINAVENRGLPEDYYLKDTNGQRIEVWPGSYRLNLTKPYVADYQARYAYQLVLDSDLQLDGCFIDNVFTSQSWQTHDIFGHPVAIDADEDGQADDPAAFDAAWKAGVFDELAAVRRLLPYAVLSGHAMDINEPGISQTFNGISIGFLTTDVIEGKQSFSALWDRYNDWLDLARAPQATMIESSPPDQISYGYDYQPLDHAPASTQEFARTYYPYVRFGLAFTLMNDGYFAHEWGDTWHGNDWWYDELDYDLGHPVGPARHVDIPPAGGPQDEIVDNGDFEEPLAGTWRLWANAGTGCQAAVTADPVDAASGALSARVTITSTSGTDWHIELAQHDRSWTSGTTYEVSFAARADQPRWITVNAQKGSPDWRNYGLHRRLAIGTDWGRYAVTFDATESTGESRLQFMVGESAGTVWIDDVKVVARGPAVYEREFTRGLAVLNGSREVQTVTVGSGYRRLAGNQAARFERILDDVDEADDPGTGITPGFTTTGDWEAVTYDSGEWQAAGPFYHDWGQGCHERHGTTGEARWTLPIEATDTYTVTAWWPAAPAAAAWTDAAAFDVVGGDHVLASASLDQRTGGDEWHAVAVVHLDPADHPYVRLTCTGPAPCIADALHVRSAARYNDGSPAHSVTLQPMDGIVLQRTSPPAVYLPIATSPAAAAAGRGSAGADPGADRLHVLLDLGGHIAVQGATMAVHGHH